MVDIKNMGNILWHINVNKEMKACGTLNMSMQGKLNAAAHKICPNVPQKNSSSS